MNRGLSKSKLMSFRQCPKKLWLEVHRPELAVEDPQAEAIFAMGHEIGEIARRLYDDGSGVMIEYDAGMTAALAHTSEVLGRNSASPVFEATVERDGLLVRADVLLREADGPRLIEVKSSTKLKPEHLVDCAIQSWVFEGSSVRPQRIALAHVHNPFVYPGDGNYAGLLIEEDVTTAIAPLRDQVPELLESAKKVLQASEPEIAVGTRCRKPYSCPFQDHCWQKTDFPIRGLPAINSRLDALIAAGHFDVRNIPDGLLTDAGQLRVWRAVQQGRAELLPGAREILAALPYPRYYLDFETISFAVPRWAGTRPYQQIPFQWSLHIEERNGSLRHEEFLDLTGELPARAVAEALLKVLGTVGPVFMYTTFERTCINTLADFCPDLRKELMAVAARLVDLHPIVKEHYYHPAMQGSWSIKAVLPTIAPELDYKTLGGIQEGTAAQQAYLDAISPEHDGKQRAEIRNSLLKYCKHDTLAMVVVAKAISQQSASAPPT
ncbi:MAG: DUF2779 domain-containing protein [Steroidobacteraceae bacterium]